MKTILLIAIILVLSLQADKMFISGISMHGEEQNIDGNPVNSLNYGLGYQKEYNNQTITALLLKDSFNNPMASLTYGIRREIFENVSIGVEFGAAYKNIIYKDDYGSNYKYTIVPIAFIPTISIKENSFSIDILYLPEMNKDTFHVMSVTLMMIGIEL